MRGIEKRRGLCRPYRANRLTMIVDFFNSYPGLKPAVGRLSARAITGRAFSPTNIFVPFRDFTPHLISTCELLSPTDCVWPFLGCVALWI